MKNSYFTYTERIRTVILCSLIPLVILFASFSFIAASGMMIKNDMKSSSAALPAAAFPDAAATMSEAAEPHNNIFTTISFVGDCLLASDYGRSGKGTFNYAAAENDPEFFFSGVNQILATDNYTVANCENVFTDTDLPEVQKNHDPAYWYRGPASNAEIFTAGSVEIVSLANNHTYDYGQKGRNDTIEAVERAGLLWGNDDKPLILENNGIKIALYMCSMYSAHQSSKIINWLNEVIDTTDYQIVYYHGGTERVYEPDEWRAEASRALVDAGADLVIGNHPHVIQPIEQYNGGIIVHSLGNFIFGGSHITDNLTIIYRLSIGSVDGKIISVSGEAIPCYEYKGTYSNWQPQLIEEGDENYAKIIGFLSGTDKTPH